MTPLEVFPWEDVKRGNDDVCMLREYSRRKGDETGDDNILTLCKPIVYIYNNNNNI